MWTAETRRIFAPFGAAREQNTLQCGEVLYRKNAFLKGFGRTI